MSLDSLSVALMHGERVVATTQAWRMQGLTEHEKNSGCRKLPWIGYVVTMRPGFGTSGRLEAWAADRRANDHPAARRRAKSRLLLPCMLVFHAFYS